MDEQLELLHALFSHELYLECSPSGAIEFSIPIPGSASVVRAHFAAPAAAGPLSLVDVRGDGVTGAVRARLLAAGRLALPSGSGAIAELTFDAMTRVAEALELEQSSGASRSISVAATAPSDGTGAPLSNVTMLLRLDHMRARKDYSSLIAGFASQCALSGCLLFVERLILILLVGPSAGCQKYLRLHRTTTVDIDCAGRRCKEKMMGVLYQGTITSDAPGGGGGAPAHRLAFDVLEGSTPPAQAVALLLQAGVPADVLRDLPPLRAAAAAAGGGATAGEASGDRGSG